MADLLTHVLIAYVLVTVARWRLSFPRHWVPVAMGGAAIPDLVKVNIPVESSLVEGVLGMGFSYGPISSLAGVVLLGGAIALAFDDDYRRRAYAFLVAGGICSLVVDGLRAYADGRADFWLYPIPWRPPTPSLYVTSDPRVLVFALVVAFVIFVVDRGIVGAQ